MRPTRASPAPWHSATNGWPQTTVNTGGSRRAMARSSSIFHPNAAGTAPLSISALPWRRITVGCRDGATFEADAAILTVPLPLLSKIALPSAAHERVAATADIGFGNVIKILLRFTTKWWADHGGRDLVDLSFLLSDATVPTWWTQHPDEYPVLTGWLAGLKADRVSSLSEAELVDMGLASLAQIFDLPSDGIRRHLVASRAINWGNDPFARGAYSYATPKTRQAQSLLRQSHGDAIFFCGEALYAGPDMGTVEAALASGQETAQTILTGSPGTSSHAR